MFLFVFTTLVMLMFGSIGHSMKVAKPIAKKIPTKPAKRRGDWRDLSRKPGWNVFNNEKDPFDPNSNLMFCNRSLIQISYSPKVADYSVVINRALKKLRRRSKPGGSVVLSKGVFPVRDQIRIPSYSCLIGAGMRETRIRLVDNAPVFSHAGVVRSTRATRVTVANLTIDGNMKGQKSKDLDGEAYGRYGLFTQLTNFLYLQGVSVQNNIGYGFDPHGSKLEWAYYLLIDGCEAVNNGLDGFTLDQTYFVTLKRSWAYNNARHGLNIVTGSNYVRVTLNVMKDNGFDSGVGCNMMAQNNQELGTKNLEFSYNRLFNARKAGFCFSDVSDVRVSNSLVENEDRRSYCYYFSKTQNVNIDSTKCQRGKGHKVWSTNGAQFEL